MAYTIQMKINKKLLQINRNFIIGFAASATVSAFLSDMLKEMQSHVITTIVIAVEYIVYFGIFTTLFYIDNKSRYKQMKSSQIKKELIKMISSFGAGEIVYLVVRWPTQYYFLEIHIEASIASTISIVIATVFYMAAVTIFLSKTKTFQK